MHKAPSLWCFELSILEGVPGPVSGDFDPRYCVCVWPATAPAPLWDGPEFSPNSSQGGGGLRGIGGGRRGERGQVKGFPVLRPCQLSFDRFNHCLVVVQQPAAQNYFLLAFHLSFLSRFSHCELFSLGFKLFKALVNFKNSRIGGHIFPLIIGLFYGIEKRKQPKTEYLIPYFYVTHNRKRKFSSSLQERTYANPSGLRAVAAQQYGSGSAMAIFHLAVKVFSRAKGHSAVAAAAYRAGVNLVDERDGVIHKYADRRGIVRDASLLVLPKGAPAWDRARLWNEVEKSETRKNSSVSREVEVSLPFELTAAQNVELAHEFTRWLVDKYSFSAEVNVHEPTSWGKDSRNRHAHIQMSMRELTAEGFGGKIRVLDAAKTGAPEVTMWREEWARRVNQALADHKHHARIDHRSNAARGLDALPTVHVGHGPRAPEREALNLEITTWNTEASEVRNERARVEAVIGFERQLAETREALAVMNAEALTVQQELARAKPAREVSQAREQANKMRTEIMDKRTAVKAAREHLDELPWWRMLAKRAMSSQIETGQVQLSAWDRDYREIKKTAKAPVRDDLAKRQAELDKKRETLLKVRDELMQKIAEEESKISDLKLVGKLKSELSSSSIPP